MRIYGYCDGMLLHENRSTSLMSAKFQILKEGSGYLPYLLVLQSEVLEPIPTCVVAPLLKLN